MSELLATLFAAVDAFARGAPQDDDMTAVLVKREHPKPRAGPSRRTFDALPRSFAFTAECVRAARDRPRDCCPTVDFALEELFTNMVKYSAGERRPTSASS